MKKNKRSVVRLAVTGIATIAAGVFAAMAGQDDACNRLAGSPLEAGNNGAGVESWKIDHAQAIPACEAAVAAEPDSVAARFRLGRAIQAAGRHEEALQHYKVAAEKGYVIAASTLGQNYLFNRKMTPDPAQAVMWYRRAADAGDATSQFQLGEAYRKREGVPQDTAESLNWYRKAADQKYPPSLFMVGQYYDTGTGVPRDLATAFNFYLAAAKLGYRSAEHNVSIMYAHGEGVKANAQQAARWPRSIIDSSGIPPDRRIHR